MNDNSSSYGNSIDERYWASILAEGDKSSDSDDRKDNQSKKILPKEQLNKSENDWNFVEQLLLGDKLIECEVTDFNQGGLIVTHDKFKGFIPLSHLNDVSLVQSEKLEKKSLNKYMRKSIKLKVIDIDPSRERIVLSERAANTNAGERNRLMNDLSIDDVLQGVVTNITDFGVFIDLGGVEGLVHISELSWHRVKEPKKLFQIGQAVTVKVLGIEAKSSRVSLSIKRLLPNPWLTVLENFPMGKQYTATVVDVVKFGAFVKLEDGLEGLIHISEMKLMDGDRLKDILEAGEQILVELISVDIERQRMSLRLVV